MEVPTPLYIFEQTVDSPVPRGRGGCRLQGFLPGQSSSSSGVIPRVPSGTPGQSSVQRTVAQTVDIPAPFGGPPLHVFHTVCQGSHPGQSSPAFTEQLVDDGDLQGFHP